MTLPLPLDLQQFADRQIASGKYTSLDEMMLADTGRAGTDLSGTV